MEAAAVRKSLENLGLHMVFARVGSLVGDDLPKQVHPRKEEALKKLGRFLNEAISGVELTAQRRQGGHGSLATLNDSINAERAYRAIQPILPDDVAKAGTSLRELNRIRQRILERKPPSRADRRKLHDFCRKVLTHLDRERFEVLQHPLSMWP